MNVHCKVSSMQKNAKNDLFSNKLSESKLDKVSQVFDQLNEQHISLEEVANDIDVKEMLARISQYKEKFSEERTENYGFSIYAWLKSFACLSKKREQEILIFTYKVSGKWCCILLPLVIIYMLDWCTSTWRQCIILKYPTKKVYE